MLVGYVITDGADENMMFARFEPERTPYRFQLPHFPEGAGPPRVKVLWTTTIDDATVYNLTEHETAVSTAIIISEHVGRPVSVRKLLVGSYA
jgi:hypothetical protein